MEGLSASYVVYFVLVAYPLRYSLIFVIFEWISQAHHSKASNTLIVITTKKYVWLMKSTPVHL